MQTVTQGDKHGLELWGALLEEVSFHMDRMDVWVGTSGGQQGHLPLIWQGPGGKSRQGSGMPAWA